uniref:Uncharacterized protein n=1 Tax=Clandestinovirus TaxID=2831644 RepID=A0A8F8KL17_9VIRU|nr:hypothetical protein KOM_12_375 [Clandestinovirus]
MSVMKAVIFPLVKWCVTGNQPQVALMVLNAVVANPRCVRMTTTVGCKLLYRISCWSAKMMGKQLALLRERMKKPAVPVDPLDDGWEVIEPTAPPLSPLL